MTQTLKNIIINTENKFVTASRLVNGINCTIDSWKRKYGKNYCNGFKEERWIYCQTKWVNRLEDVLKLLEELDSTLYYINKLIKKQDIKTNVVISCLERIDQIKDKIKYVLDELSIINIVIDNYNAHDPINRRIKKDNKFLNNPNYIDFTKILNDADKQRLFNLCLVINSLVGLQSIYSTLSKSLFPLIDTPNNESKDNNLSLGVGSSLKDQLLAYKRKQEDEVKKDKDHFNKWVTTQYENFNSIPINGNLLEDDTLYGVCQLPIIMVNFYINKDNKKILNHIGYKLSHVLGNYLIIENALLLGIHNKEYKNHSDIDKAWNIIKGCLDIDVPDTYKNTIKQNKLVPIGPLVKKETHFYALLVPSIFIQYKGSGFTLNSWDIKIK